MALQTALARPSCRPDAVSLPTRHRCCAAKNSLLSRCCALVLLLIGLQGFTPFRASAEDALPRGAVIYQERCAGCHGSSGEGTDEYAQPLTGDLSVRELAELIETTMPAGAPEDCVGPDAQLVAEFMHGAFYSILAQERNRPATIEFCRLTARQHEFSVSDLIASFRGKLSSPGEPGLRGEYFVGKSPGGNVKAIERVDSVVEFQFGVGRPEGFPLPEKDPDDESEEKTEQTEPPPIGEESEYSIRWTGSLFAPVTGEYELVVVSQNGVRMWFNHERSLLIDGWVKSSNQTEYRSRVRLLGGRWYPLRLEMARYREPDGGIALKWKPPRLAEELIPQKHLTAEKAREVYLPTTPFPPDDRSLGYERGSAVTMEWEAAAASLALETANYVLSVLDELSRSKRQDGDRLDQLRTFCSSFAERAFRRPLNDTERALFVEKQFEDAPSPETAVQRSVLLALMSPRFLYRETIIRPLDEFAVAAWLSYSLWDSLPDEQLLQAARQKQLNDHDQLVSQVQRMQSDPLAMAKLHEFLICWLQLDQREELVKDTDSFPEFEPAIFAELATSLDRFIESVLHSPEADLRELFLSERIWLNGRLSRLYGATRPETADDREFLPVELPDQGRVGLLTHPLLLASLAYPSTSSPIHRGVFVSRSLLGRRLKPPPEAFAPLAPDLHAELNTRERVQLQTSPGACQSCHGMINPLGFSLEQFDAVGRYRKEERGRPIDSSGGYIDRQGASVEFTQARDLAVYLAASPEAHSAFVEQLFQYLFKQPLRAFGELQQEEFRQSLSARQYNIHELIRDMAVTTAEKIPLVTMQTANGPME